MKILSVKDVDKNLKELEILVDKEVFKDAMAKSVKKNAPKANVPGFRKGKAPKALIEKYYGKGYFYEDALNECVPQSYEEALDETGLDVVSSPEYDIKTIEEGQDLVFTAKVYTRPLAEIENYLGMEIEVEHKEVTDEDVAAKLEQERKQNSREVEITDRAAQNGDIVNIDYKGTVDGVAFDGGTSEGYNLTLGSKTFIPGFEDQICGHNVGDEFDVNVKFPDDYHEESLKGKDAVFACKLNGIKFDELPELDDEFAKDVSEFDTLDEYKADLRKQLEEENKKYEDSEVRRILSSKLSENVKVDVPQSMYDRELEDVLRDYEARLNSQGISLDIYFKYTGQTIDNLKSYLKPQAENNVKARLALEAIVKKEDIKVTSEEITKEYDDLAKQYSMEVEKIKTYVRDQDLEKDIACRKAFDLVVEKAVVSQKAEKVEEEKPASKKTTKAKATKAEKVEEEKPAVKKTTKAKAKEEVKE